jgi:hypothetical protein
MQAQIAKEVEAQQVFKRERDDALDEVAALKGTVEKLTQARADATAKQADAQQALKRERDSTLDEVGTLKTTVGELTQAREDAESRTAELSQRLTKLRQSKAQETARSIAAAFSPFVIVAAVATAGFWTYQLIWSAPQPILAITSDSTADAETKLKAAEIEQQRLKEEVQRQTKAAADADAKLKAALTEQQRLAKAATDADSKRGGAEAEQQRLRDEVQRLTKAAADADAKSRLAEAKLAAANAATRSASVPQAASAPSFERQINMRAVGYVVADGVSLNSVGECEQKCTSLAACTAFSYDKSIKKCYFYQNAVLISDQQYDSGVRNSTPPPQSTTGLFTIRSNTEAWGRPADNSVSVSSISECEQRCAQSVNCKVFAYDRPAKMCHPISRADFKPNQNFDSGIRN